MTIYLKEEDPSARSGQNSLGTRTYTRAFTLVSTSQSEGPYTVGSHPDLPQIGDQHDEDSQAYCFEVSIAQKSAWKVWTYTAQYSTDKELNRNPLYDPAVITWDGENFEEVAFQDRNGDAILNSAGDPFENLMRERSRRIATVVKNVLGVPSWVIEQENAVNSAAFVLDGYVIAAGLAMLAQPSISEWKKRNTYDFRTITFQIKLNRDGWSLKPLDAGFSYIAGGQKRRAVNPDGTDPTTPICLNGSGGMLSNPTPATAVFGSFNVYPSFDFNLLPLS